MKKQITITVDVVTGYLGYDTGEDFFTPVEMVGILEHIKALVLADFVNS